MLFIILSILFTSFEKPSASLELLWEGTVLDAAYDQNGDLWLETPDGYFNYNQNYYFDSEDSVLLMLNGNMTFLSVEDKETIIQNLIDEGYFGTFSLRHITYDRRVFIRGYYSDYTTIYFDRLLEVTSDLNFIWRQTLASTSNPIEEDYFIRDFFNDKYGDLYYYRYISASYGSANYSHKVNEGTVNTFLHAGRTSGRQEVLYKHPEFDHQNRLLLDIDYDTIPGSNWLIYESGSTKLVSIHGYDHTPKLLGIAIDEKISWLFTDEGVFGLHGNVAVPVQVDEEVEVLNPNIVIRGDDSFLIGTDEGLYSWSTSEIKLKTISLCEGESLDYEGVNIDVDTLFVQEGEAVDSLIQVVVNTPVRQEFFETLINQESVIINEVTFDNTEDSEEVSQSVEGCDSLINNYHVRKFDTDVVYSTISQYPYNLPIDEMSNEFTASNSIQWLDSGIEVRLSAAEIIIDQGIDIYYDYFDQVSFEYLDSDSIGIVDLRGHLNLESADLQSHPVVLNLGFSEHPSNTLVQVRGSESDDWLTFEGYPRVRYSFSLNNILSLHGQDFSEDTQFRVLHHGTKGTTPPSIQYLSVEGGFSLETTIATNSINYTIPVYNRSISFDLQNLGWPIDQVIKYSVSVQSETQNQSYDGEYTLDLENRAIETLSTPEVFDFSEIGAYDTEVVVQYIGSDTLNAITSSVTSYVVGVIDSLPYFQDFESDLFLQNPSNGTFTVNGMESAFYSGGNIAHVFFNKEPLIEGKGSLAFEGEIICGGCAASSESEFIFILDLTDYNIEKDSIYIAFDYINHSNQSTLILSGKANNVEEWKDLFIDDVVSGSVTSSGAILLNNKIAEFSDQIILRFRDFPRDSRPYSGLTVDNIEIMNEVTKTILFGESDLVHSIYPNPTQNFINIALPQDRALDFTLSTLTGEIVKRGTISSDSPIDMRESLKGIYLMTIKLEDGSQITRKIIKN